MRGIRRAVAVAFATGLIAAACSPASSNPIEVVGKAKTAMQSVSTFHFQANAEGTMIVGVEDTSPSPGASGESPAPAVSPAPTETVSAEPTPSGPASTSIPLGGTILTGQANLADGTAAMSGTVPGLPGMAGDIVIDLDQAYIRASGEGQFHAIDPASLPFNPADSSNFHGTVDAILTLAGDPNMKASLVGVEGCQEGDCYHVRVPITADEANKNFGAGGFAVGSGQLDIWILTSSNRVARVEFLSSDAQSGNFWGRVLFTKYGQPVDIQAPAPDQIAPN